MKEKPEQKSPKESEIKIITGIRAENIGTFELYCLWKSLPSFFRVPPFPYKKRGEAQGERPTSKEFLERMGVEDAKIYELAEIKNQQQFSIVYGIGEDTLSEWNKKQEVRDSLQEIRSWARELTKNMILVLYEKALRDGDPFKIKLFLQSVEGWEEKSKVDHTYPDITEIVIVKKQIESKPVEEIKNIENGVTTTVTSKVGANG